MVRVHNTFPVRVLMDDKLVSDVAVPFFLPLTGKFFLFECIFFWWIAVGRYIYFLKKESFNPPQVSLRLSQQSYFESVVLWEMSRFALLRT